MVGGGGEGGFCTEPFWNAIKRSTVKHDAAAAAAAAVAVTLLRATPAMLCLPVPFLPLSHLSSSRVAPAGALCLVHECLDVPRYNKQGAFRTVEF